MDEYPSNSHRQKESAISKPPKETPEQKKIEKVVENEVVLRKKTVGKRFKETFFSGDTSKGVVDYMFFDVLVPYAKDAIADAAQQGLERKLYGEVRSSSRRGGRVGSNVGHTAYNRMSRSSYDRPDPRDRERDEPRRKSARATHNFDDYVLQTRAEAEEVIDRLFDLVSQYEMATVAELYELIGVQGNYTDRAWGWTDIRGSEIVRVRNGYILDLPRPVPLD